MSDFSLVTFNMHKGFSGDWKKSLVLDRMRKELKTVDADIVFLQETVGEHKAHSEIHEDWPDNSQFEFIADSLWPNFAYGKNAHYDNGHHGNAILCKYPLKKWENIDVSPYPFAASRSLLHAVIELPRAANVHLVCVHLGFIGFERRNQIRTLCEHIEEKIPHAEPLIIAGDFNDWRGKANQVFDQQLGLQEAHQQIHGSYARSYPSKAPMLRLDRIYYRGLQLKDAERLAGPGWINLSDHLPISARFAL